MKKALIVFNLFLLFSLSLIGLEEIGQINQNDISNNTHVIQLITNDDGSSFIAVKDNQILSLLKKGATELNFDRYFNFPELIQDTLLIENKRDDFIDIEVLGISDSDLFLYKFNRDGSVLIEVLYESETPVIELAGRRTSPNSIHAFVRLENKLLSIMIDDDYPEIQEINFDNLASSELIYYPTFATSELIDFIIVNNSDSSISHYYLNNDLFNNFKIANFDHGVFIEFKTKQMTSGQKGIFIFENELIFSDLVGSVSERNTFNIKVDSGFDAKEIVGTDKDGIPSLFYIARTAGSYAIINLVNLETVFIDSSRIPSDHVFAFFNHSTIIIPNNSDTGIHKYNINNGIVEYEIQFNDLVPYTFIDTPVSYKQPFLYFKTAEKTDFDKTGEFSIYRLNLFELSMMNLGANSAQSTDVFETIDVEKHILSFSRSAVRYFYKDEWNTLNTFYSSNYIEIEKRDVSSFNNLLINDFTLFGI